MCTVGTREWTYQRGPQRPASHIKAKQKAPAMEEALNDPTNRMTAIDVSWPSTSAIPELGCWAHGQSGPGDREGSYEWAQLGDVPRMQPCHSLLGHLKLLLCRTSPKYH